MARLTPENVARAEGLISLYPSRRSALVPLLHLVQEQDGYLSAEGIEHAAELLGLTPAEVRGTASFYDMFHLEPVGRYVVAVCTNIACMLEGAYELLAHLQQRLGITPGGTTPDGAFTLEEAECLALCGNAPCLTVNWRFFGDMTPRGWDALAEDLLEGRLSDEVPLHGTLCRVRRSVGLAPGTAGASGTPEKAPGKAGDKPTKTAGAGGAPGSAEAVPLAASRTTSAIASTLHPGQPGEQPPAEAQP
ncbi:MAG TPA: NAD(P)H-dependent oxidoreductase subunit E [Acidimicrobiales bacterium]|nr:NAD(P)H-dependent oxidoreductase subunit E [Acidimicrobiales bacterium]